MRKVYFVLLTVLALLFSSCLPEKTEDLNITIEIQDAPVSDYSTVYFVFCFDKDGDQIKCSELHNNKGASLKVPYDTCSVKIALTGNYNLICYYEEKITGDNQKITVSGDWINYFSSEPKATSTQSKVYLTESSFKTVETGYTIDFDGTKDDFAACKIENAKNKYFRISYDSGQDCSFYCYKYLSTVAEYFESGESLYNNPELNCDFKFDGDTLYFVIRPEYYFDNTKNPKLKVTIEDPSAASYHDWLDFDECIPDENGNFYLIKSTDDSDDYRYDVYYYDISAEDNMKLTEIVCNVKCAEVFNGKLYYSIGSSIYCHESNSSIFTGSSQNYKFKFLDENNIILFNLNNEYDWAGADKAGIYNLKTQKYTASINSSQNDIECPENFLYFPEENKLLYSDSFGRCNSMTFSESLTNIEYSTCSSNDFEKSFFRLGNENRFITGSGVIFSCESDKIEKEDDSLTISYGKKISDLLFTSDAFYTLVNSTFTNVCYVEKRSIESPYDLDSTSQEISDFTGKKLILNDSGSLTVIGNGTSVKYGKKEILTNSVEW